MLRNRIFVMADLDDVKIANLNAEDIKTIQALERKLGAGICLVAVEKKDVLYVLEAKLAPNQWQRVDKVYRDIQDLKAYFNNYESARETKTALKRFLIQQQKKRKLAKRPIRIRQVVNTEQNQKAD